MENIIVHWKMQKSDFVKFWSYWLFALRWRIMSFLVSEKNKLAITHTFAIKLKEKWDAMVVDGHHVPCVAWWLNENPNLKKKKKKNWRLGFFFKIGEKSTLTPLGMGQISNFLRTQKNPWVWSMSSVGHNNLSPFKKHDFRLSSWQADN